MNRVDRYLAIPEDYGRWLGGLRWARREAVEYSAEDREIGCTFAMGGEIALFLEGFASGGDLVCFGFILHLLHLLGLGIKLPRPRRAPRFEVVARDFLESGRPLRNAGALCAELCRGLPRAADPPAVSEVCYDLNHQSGGWTIPPPGGSWAGLAEVPPLDPAAFEVRVLSALARFSLEDLRHWLRHGRGPSSGAGEAVAQLVPRTLGAALEALGRRPRLASAAPMVACLEGALALPPRRLAPAELPTGGYADVATRGLPEQILPSQLALDGEEFVRRFAEREILYYQREEPRAPVADEVVVLLDQGVRTWGDVRLVLAASFLALARQAERRGVPLRIAATSAEGAVQDPLDIDDEALGTLLEASDLSPHPGQALERVLEGRPGLASDVVILTHPRSLTHEDVLASTRRAAPGTRLFAIAVDGGGEVQLSEVRRGILVARARCRVRVRGAVDHTQAPPALPSAPASPSASWKGDVESPGFPFVLGALSPIRDRDRTFDFDESGERVLLAGRHGLLHAWKVDGTEAEMLPRALVGGRPLASVDTVIGVAGGFVVAGRIDKEHVAVHYDFPGRTCIAHVLHDSSAWHPDWSYARRYHSIVAGDGTDPIQAIDLGAERSVASFPPRSGGDAASPRAARAYRNARDASPEHLAIGIDSVFMPENVRAIRVRSASGEVDIQDDNGPRRTWLPLSDGQPALKGCRLYQASTNGEVVGAIIGDSSRRTFFLFSLKTSRPIVEAPLDADAQGFALSRDGRRFACKRGGRHLEIRDVAGGATPLLLTPKGKAHNQLEVELGAGFLAVDTGKNVHLLRWDRGCLEVQRRGVSTDGLVSQTFGGVPSARVRASRRTDGLPFDRQRFYASCSVSGLTALVDILGQVSLLDDSGALVCMIFAFRDRLAAWMPDGTRFGPPTLIGGSPTPGAEERIGLALLRASRAARSPSP